MEHVERIAGTEKLNRETLVDRLSAQLRQLIVSESIKPGEAFPSERELCEAFGVGRTTVREALQGLVARGAIERKGKELIVVDDDIDIHDPVDVEYAVATRMEASRDLLVMPGVRGHEYIRVSDRGMRAKLGIDATVSFADRDRFARAPFAAVTPLSADDWTDTPTLTL